MAWTENGLCVLEPLVAKLEIESVLRPRVLLKGIEQTEGFLMAEKVGEFRTREVKLMRLDVTAIVCLFFGCAFGSCTAN